METVLVVGATGHIGTSAVIAALRSKRNVLAVVRNQASAEKLFQNVGSRDGITTVETNILSEQGIQSVVDQVKAGKLPSFQHVYAAAGGLYEATPLHKLSKEELHQNMNTSFETNFFAYRATIPYLLEQNDSRSTWTLCTGAAGDLGMRAAPALTQGALYSMATVACRDNEQTNVRFNEVYLALRVEVDSSAERTGAAKASDFARSYETILARPDIRSSRISVRNQRDFTDLLHAKKAY
ncbi:MAG: hypothetical protein M1820_003385 [Bogoriella megaspora]|nr:MAG: hypothetical protein M1820_003385 [Bogoriella megaspora]